jgi:hypothetical protein
VVVLPAGGSGTLIITSLRLILTPWLQIVAVLVAPWFIFGFDTPKELSEELLGYEYDNKHWEDADD